MKQKTGKTKDEILAFSQSRSFRVSQQRVVIDFPFGIKAYQHFQFTAKSH